MKKLPLVFCLLLFACSEQKQTVDNAPLFSRHPEPYRVFAVGTWNADYSILTLTDARSDYFNIKTIYNNNYKKGAVYVP
ncbi:MAG: hypothetical protein JWR50_1080 [Mucilaginibacter sp.]|nr:hypothetical protein [Mucilaginibacter sp.]